MAASGLALILMPWAVLFRHRRAVHRILGRITATLILIGVSASLPSAIASQAPLLARLGFLTQGVLCLVFLFLAVAAIRAGRVSQHARLMLSLGALIFGAVLLRTLILLAARLGMPFEAAYSAIAWLSWFLPLAAVGLWPTRPASTIAATVIDPNALKSGRELGLDWFRSSTELDRQQGAARRNFENRVIGICAGS